MRAARLKLYGILLLSLLVFALSIGRKADRPDYLIQTPVEKRKLRNRTILATALILLLIPLTLFIGVYCFGGKRYYFISLLILLECMLPFFLIFEGRKPQARELVLIAVLVALECRRPRRVLHAAGVQAGRGNDDPGGRGLRRRNGIP